MNLFKLMSATHAIATVREKPAVFVTAGVPSFGWSRETQPHSSDGRPRRWRGFWQILWPFCRARPAVADAMGTSTPASRPGAVPEQNQSRRLRLGRRIDPAQRELAFERLKPVRNDLRDEDYEVTMRRVLVPKVGTEACRRKAYGPVARQAVLFSDDSAR